MLGVGNPSYGPPTGALEGCAGKLPCLLIPLLPTLLFGVHPYVLMFVNGVISSLLVMMVLAGVYIRELCCPSLSLYELSS